MSTVNQCARTLGRKGGLAAKKKKAGIHSPEYKRKHKASAAPKKKAATKKPAARKKAAPKKKAAPRKKAAPKKKLLQGSLFQ